MATNGAYRRILVPVRDGPESERAVRVACGLAANRGACITGISVVEVPPLLPLEAHMDEEEAEARAVLQAAQAIADSYGVAFVGRVVRERDAASAILAEVEEDGAEIVVLGVERRRNGSRRAPVFGKTAGAVLKGSPTRVVLVSDQMDSGQ